MAFDDFNVLEICLSADYIQNIGIVIMKTVKVAK